MAPILISDPTVQQLRAILARSPEARPEHAIRLYISGLSESGPEWSLSLDTYSPDADECCDFDGLRVIIERGLLEAVGGIRVEYEAMPADDGSDDGGFLIEGLDPDFQALYRPCGGGCGGCGGCHGCHGCHHDERDDDFCACGDPCGCGSCGGCDGHADDRD